MVERNKKLNYFYVEVNRNLYMGFYAPKSADRILFLDMVGTFFAFKRVIAKCRSPPTINLDFKKIWIDRRN